MREWLNVTSRSCAKTHANFRQATCWWWYWRWAYRLPDGVPTSILITGHPWQQQQQHVNTRNEMSCETRPHFLFMQISISSSSSPRSLLVGCLFKICKWGRRRRRTRKWAGGRGGRQGEIFHHGDRRKSRILNETILRIWFLRVSAFSLVRDGLRIHGPIYWLDCFPP